MKRKATSTSDHSASEPPAKREKKDASPAAVPNLAGTTALKFDVTARWNKARVGKLTLPHGVVDTPVFMPVGTQGTIKGLTSAQVESLGPQIILGNTYHLGVRPGTQLIDDLGGLHKFMNWKRNLLTDSGGFQMVSLFDLAQITEEGVSFQSPVDGSQLLLTPELSIHYQNQIGADIMMALDDVCSSLTVGPRVEEAMHRTLRWIDRCIKAHKRPHDQNLFGIVQGGLQPKLRDYCLREMVKRVLPGYAIGGLAGGEDKRQFWRVVHQSTGVVPRVEFSAAQWTEALGKATSADKKSSKSENASVESSIKAAEQDFSDSTRTTYNVLKAMGLIPDKPSNGNSSSSSSSAGDSKSAFGALRTELMVPEDKDTGVVFDDNPTQAAGLPDNKPRYLMGVGYPLDLVVCVSLGVDMFDCVWPSRTARFGTAIVPEGLMHLKKAQFATDTRPIDADCDCVTCKNYSRAYLHGVVTKEAVACHLVTLHNLAQMMRLMRQMRAAIAEGRFPPFVRQFMARQFPKKNYPLWAVEALSAAGIELDDWQRPTAAELAKQAELARAKKPSHNYVGKKEKDEAAKKAATAGSAAAAGAGADEQQLDEDDAAMPEAS